LKYFRYMSFTAGTRRELVLGAIDVGVVHVERTHAHEAEQLARSARSDSSSRIPQAQRQVAVTARFSRKDAVVMRAVHGFEVIALAEGLFSSSSNGFITRFHSAS
jgi:hypothetical protein